MRGAKRRYYCVVCEHVHRRSTYGRAPCTRCGGETVLGSPRRIVTDRVTVTLPRDVMVSLGPRPALALRWLAESFAARQAREKNV